MARYIDIDKAIKQLSPYARWGDDGREVIGFSEVKTILSVYSKADVVPKSEVENLQKKLNDYERVVGKLSFTVDGVATLLIGKEVEYIDKRVAEGLKNMAVHKAKQEITREIVQILKDYAKSDDCLTYNMSDKEQNELCKIHNLGVNEVKQSISIIAMDIEKKYIGEVTKNV